MSHAVCIVLPPLQDGMAATLLNNVFIFLSCHASFDPTDLLRKAISSHAHRKLFGSKTCMVWFVIMYTCAYEDVHLWCTCVSANCVHTHINVGL